MPFVCLLVSSPPPPPPPLYLSTCVSFCLHSFHLRQACLPVRKHGMQQQKKLSVSLLSTGGNRPLWQNTKYGCFTVIVLRYKSIKRDNSAHLYTHTHTSPPPLPPTELVQNGHRRGLSKFKTLLNQWDETLTG